MKKMTMKQDMADDKKKGIKEDSKKDNFLDKKRGVREADAKKKGFVPFKKKAK